MLSSEVINDLDRKTTMNDLDPAVFADPNDSVSMDRSGRQVVLFMQESSETCRSCPAKFSCQSGEHQLIYQSGNWRRQFLSVEKNGLDVVEPNKILTIILDLNASLHEEQFR